MQGASAPPPTNAAPGQLFLRDGDLLSGKLLDIDGKRTLRWQHADAAEAIEFNLDSVSQIRFHPILGSPAPGGSDTVRFCQLSGRGDHLEGTLVSYDRTNLCLQTWYAGLLSIPRGGLRSVWFPPGHAGCLRPERPGGLVAGQRGGGVRGGSGPVGVSGQRFLRLQIGLHRARCQAARQRGHPV